MTAENAENNAENNKITTEKACGCRRFPLPTPKRLHSMSGEDFRDIDTKNLTDLESVSIDPSLDCAQWQRELIAQTGNPFFVRILGYPVRMTI